MLTKIFSALLSVTLVLGICPTVALADTDNDIDYGSEDISINETSVADEGSVATAETVEDISLSASPLATGDIASGTLGTCTWTIDSEGCLTIAPTNGVSGEFSMEGNVRGSSWPWNDYRSDIVSITVKSGVSATGSLAYLFCNCSSLTSLDLPGFNTSNVTNMHDMFGGCSSLTSLDVSGFDTSNVTDMNWMFGNCFALTSLDVSNFDTSNVTDMGSMFYFCSSMTRLDVSNFDTSNVTDMNWMFANCSSLIYLDVSHFNTSSVTDMSYMFGGCSSLTSLDLSGFDTSNVTNASSMFQNCSNLRSVIVGKKFAFASYLPTPRKSGTSVGSTETGKWMSDDGAIYDDPSDIPNYKAATYTAVFSADKTTLEKTIKEAEARYSGDYTTKSWATLQSVLSVAKYILDEFIATQTDVDAATDALQSAIDGLVRTNDDIDSGLLGTCIWRIDPEGCLTITPEDGKSGSFEITDPSYDSWPWYEHKDSIVSAKIDSGVSATGSLGYMFYDCSSLASINVSNLNTSNVTDMYYMFYGCSSLTSLDLSSFDTSNVVGMYYMFYNCKSLTSLNLSSFSTSNVTNMNYMFYYCSSLTSLNVTKFDTSNVLGMNSMFYYCSSLTSLDVSKFNTSNVIQMDSMFVGCRSLTSLDVSGFNTSSVTDMGYMFNSCSSLTSLDLSSFDTSSVTAMRRMFTGCTSLTSLDLSSLDTSSVKYMDYMFSDCSSLTSLNLSGLTTPKVTQTTYMFWNCTSLTSLDLSSFDTPNLIYTISMFEGCTSLTSLDMSNFDTSNVISKSDMFKNCTGLRSVIVGEKFKLASSLPVPIKDDVEGKWMSDDGTIYNDPSDIPSNVAATYTAVFPADKTILESTIKEAEALDATRYTSNSWATLKAALSEAKDVMDNDYAATQTKVDAVTETLQNAIDSLVRVAGNADKTELEMTIKAVSQLNESDYTSNSWAALQDILQDAQKIDADYSAIQSEVDEVTDALLAAIDALQKLFVDVSDPNEWYYEYVYYMAELGIITGYNETTFGVGDSMTRAQLVTILWRYCAPEEYANYNETAATNTSGLPDNPDGMYYTQAVNWAVAGGVVTGNLHEDGTYTFNPDDPITFEQMVTIVARYVLGFNAAEKYSTAALTRGAFTDAATVSYYARGSMSWAIDNGVVTGNNNGDGTYTIVPLENVARERAATVLARAIQSELITPSLITPKYTLNVSSTEGGQVVASVDGNKTAYWLDDSVNDDTRTNASYREITGSDHSLEMRITPSSGYEVASVSGMEGVDVSSSGGTYTIDNISSNIDIKVTFQKIAPKYTYDVYVLGQAGEQIYSDCTYPIYIKTDNPDGYYTHGGTFKYSIDKSYSSVIRQWDNVDYLEYAYSSNVSEVPGGYLANIEFKESGTYTFEIYEGEPGTYDLRNKILVKSITFEVVDTSAAEEEWIDDLIANHTTEDMDPFEKMNAISKYLRSADSGFTYTTNYNGSYIYLADAVHGPYFITHKWNSYSSPAALCDIAYRIGGFDDIHDCYGDYAYGTNEWYQWHYYCRVTIGDITEYYYVCPSTSTGTIDSYDMVDFNDTSKMLKLG